MQSLIRALAIPSLRQCPLPFRGFSTTAVSWDRRGSRVELGVDVHQAEDWTAYKPSPGLTFQEGDLVLLRDRSKGMKTLVGPVTAEGVVGSHLGQIKHSQIIGQLPRTEVRTHKGKPFTIHKPTLEEFVLLAPRHATPSYPKDANMMTMMLDVFPGARILEAGTGNGGLTLFLARSACINTLEGKQGKIDTIDIREEHSRKAQQLIAKFERGYYSQFIQFKVGTLSQSLNDHPPTEPYDGIALDMPEPWVELPSALKWLKNDRFLVCYIPNVTQVLQLLSTVRKYKYPLALESVQELNLREWDIRPTYLKAKRPVDQEIPDAPESGVIQPIEEIEPWVCRPTHDPSGHTAFLVKLRKCINIRVEAEAEAETQVEANEASS
ncbi:S-adenosyl-L-methionine-dependent methyltransferase [Basidiobolus meristosporus CBS 931.73]|uniref:tRNA (adenine(58)-N(1))-methyltransferase catalytic subunit TRM61 n=1 Tax=Basidiobolus meristosporus CBS 931.73 TaxID=1314790 RepID=A0A1Y1Y926_9FUNG|nr:S-adenosyl-L-methionine-dependent methyltransferase [Basidiobolus meristosporus CBS 931.73]|eukprot:ORX94246.1 S-adenosyl-L-methionine-dependent methyltransferase [Basidiobolus meristosporus CBS 931.73]